jgi:hypothetical protein
MTLGGHPVFAQFLRFLAMENSIKYHKITRISKNITVLFFCGLSKIDHGEAR